MAKIEKIIIVGGGTSGWLTATYLAKHLGFEHPHSTKITLIESSEIPTVGVGEATILPIRPLIESLGIDEARFMKESSATFKLAIKFADWLYLPEDSKKHGKRPWYYHAFGRYSQVGPDILAPYWMLNGEAEKQSFVDYSMIEGKICDGMRGPKRIEDQEYRGPVEYAYHFDAGRLSTLLKTMGSELGVEHLIGTVKKVVLDSDGAIKSLETVEHGTLKADLYIDCTGFAGHLIEKAMGGKFHSFNHMLFNDAAIACQVPYSDPKCPLPPYTTSTAQENGWTWDIPLNDRRGVGYVYSSQYTDADRAEELLRGYLGKDGDDLSYLRIKMRVGSRREQWFKNCVSIGLSAGFVEPLESTGIYLVDIAVRRLVEFLPVVEQMPLAAARFNQGMNQTFEDIVDFIKLHFVLSKRTDTDFWIDNRKEDTMPASLLQKLEFWKYRVPAPLEFTDFSAIFGLTSYVQIMYGMDHLPDLSGQEDRFLYAEAARKKSERLDVIAQDGLRVLPDERVLIDEIYQTGFRANKTATRMNS